MKKMIKILTLLGLISAVGIVYAVINFGQLLEDVDFFDEDENEQND